MMRYCENCGQNVQPVKHFSWFWFLLGFLAFGVGAIVYLVHYYMIKRKVYCPICGSKTTRKE
jgi:hypothetical protein